MDDPEEKNPRISEFWHQKYRKDLGKNWNLFYKRNATRFFRDRHWIPQEFPELLVQDRDLRLFEVGCGVGNFSFPLAELNPRLDVVGCDISPCAIDLFQANAFFAANRSRFHVFVADITKDDLSAQVGCEVIDIATSIFVLSALPPESLSQTVRSVWQTVKPGGAWFIRDYAADDAAQHRFDPTQSQLSPGLFVRQDGTLAHYFDPVRLAAILTAQGLFKVTESKEIRSRTRNAKTGLDLERIFIQIKLEKLKEVAKEE